MSAPTRAALYARYSSDRQRETSIADQLRGCRERAAREGWLVVATHSDEAVSASTPVALRPGGKAMLADALASRWEVLVIEGLDRLSREVGEQEAIVKRLEHRGIRIVGVSDGYDSEAHGRKVMRIARGLVNELYLDDLRAKTHRGLAGQFARGLHVGGVSYGYRSTEADGGRRLVIDDERAAVVREIFERFAQHGETTRAIVHSLNARGVPGPRGGAWAVSALHVSHQRRLGLLHNTMYIGQEVWNRRQWIKDPDTGARRYVERPAAEWRTREAPELRIVDQAVWDAVQRRIAAGHGRARRGKGGAPRTLLAGILRCAACGGPMTAIDARRYGCAAHKDRGPTVCQSRTAVSRKDLELRLLADLRAELLEPEALAEMRRAVRQALAAHERASGAGETAAAARLQALDGEIARLADAVAQVGLSEALRARLAAAEAERATLRAQIPSLAAPRPAVDLDGLTAKWRRLVMDLGGVLSGDDRERARGLLAEILGPVTIGTDAASGEVYAELEDAAERLLLQAGGAPMGVVAGARNTSRRRLYMPANRRKP